MRQTRKLLAILSSTLVIAGACEKGDHARDATESGGGAVGASFGTGPAAGSPRPGRPGSRTETYSTSAIGEGAAAATFMGDTAGAVPPTVAQSVTPGSLPVDAAIPMIVRTGTATIKVDSLAPAIAQLRAVAQRLGGYVGNTSIQVGTEQLRSATVELKIPAGRWNQLLEGMRPIGVLEHQTESAEDVGEEFVDVTARVANARRLEARLIDLLANRTGKLSDALEVEQQIARVREEIERYQGRLRYLSSRSAISTMTVTLHEPAPIVGAHPGDSPIIDAFRTAWGFFVGFIAFLISSLGVLVPLAIIVGVIWWLVRRLAVKNS